MAVQRTMAWMLRALVLAMVLSALPSAVALQAPVSVLRIKVVVLDADRKPTPVPRYAFLVSDNPPTSTPRRIFTGPDGTAVVRLRPGNYTVESDTPFVFQGKSYEWRQVIDIVADRDDVLEMTDANAEIGAAPAGAASEAVEPNLSSILIEWQDSVVAVWTPVTRASGFVVDAGGLVVTNQRAIGTETAIEVQLAADVKVAANVLASDAEKDVAVLFVAPTVAAALRPVALGCAQPAKPTVDKGDEIVTLGAPLREPKGASSGAVNGVGAHVILSDLTVPQGSAGGPVFGKGGAVVGLTSVDDENSRRRGQARIVGLDDVCQVVEPARTKMKTAAAPSATRLPIEPSRPFPEDALKGAAQGRVGSLNPYQMSSDDFDIAFITPVTIYGAQYLTAQTSPRDRDGSSIVAVQSPIRPLLEFGNWSDYVADLRPVLLVRVTPRLVEGFWTKVARGAAQVQGMSLPPLKRVRSGFLRMRALCGDVEVTPIHPFTLVQRLSDTQTIDEGLYVFDPGALAPSCASVKLVLYSAKEPGKPETRVVDAKIVQQIWRDFEPYRQP